MAMIDPARPVVGSLQPDERYLAGDGPQTSRRLDERIAPETALGQARHTCQRCPATIPADRPLCYFCSATVMGGQRSIGRIACPICPGSINEPDHFATAGHVLAVTQDERQTMAQIARERT